MSRQQIATLLLLGATGNYGRPVASLLAKAPAVEKVWLAGRTRETLENLARELGPKAVPLVVDATDTQSVAAALRESGAGIVVNCAGSYHHTLLATAKAAIAAAVHYVDLTEDWDLVDPALALDPAARAKGVAVLVGMGGTPGANSLMALHAARSMDQCDTLHTGFAYDAAAFFPDRATVMRTMRAPDRYSAVQETIVAVCGGDIEVVRDGALTRIPAYRAEDAQRISLPAGGEIRVYPIGMSTPRTLYRHLRDVREITACMAFLPDSINRILGAFGAKYHSASNEDRGEWVIKLFEEVGALPAEMRSASADEPKVVHFAAASGRRHGQAGILTLCPTTPLSTTGSLAAAVVAMIEDRVRPVGVVFAEDVFAAESFAPLVYAALGQKAPSTFFQEIWLPRG